MPLTYYIIQNILKRNKTILKEGKGKSDEKV
jgi:hypothetical protein